VPDTAWISHRLLLLFFPFPLENTQACVISLSLRRWKMRPTQDNAEIDRMVESKLKVPCGAHSQVTAS
jgi:hypothetical protein